MRIAAAGHKNSNVRTSAFSTRYSMHFEVANEAIEQWIAKGKI